MPTEREQPSGARAEPPAGRCRTVRLVGQYQVAPERGEPVTVLQGHAPRPRPVSLV